MRIHHRTKKKLLRIVAVVTGVVGLVFLGQLIASGLAGGLPVTTGVLTAAFLGVSLFTFLLSQIR